MFIFNLSSTVYASHKSKDQRFVVTGTLVSTGLAAVGKAGIIAALCAVGLRLGLDMNSTTQSALDKFIEDNPDLINQENFGKSENGLIAVSKNAIDKFTDFLKELFNDKPSNVLTSDGKVLFSHGMSYSFYIDSSIHIRSDFVNDGYYPTGTVVTYYEKTCSTNNHVFWKKVSNVFNSTSSDSLYTSLTDEQMKKNYGIWKTYAPTYGSYSPDSTLKDDNGTIYTGNGDFILNPSWDINSNAGTLEGFPSLPWEDKIFGSTGQVGILNPDGTITGNPSIPDVENPPNTDTDTGEQTGILGWLSKFWENLWNFFMELVKALFYPTAAIAAWENLKNTINDNFKFIGQLNNIKWSTSNNQRLKIPFSYAKTTTYITIPDYIEDNYVETFRSLFKYFIYALTLFVCVQILRPKLTVGTR